MFARKEWNIHAREIICQREILVHLPKGNMVHLPEGSMVHLSEGNMVCLQEEDDTCIFVTNLQEISELDK